MPSSVLATTDRAVSGRRSPARWQPASTSGALTRLCHVSEKCNTQEVTANSSALRRAAGPVHPARRAAHRSAAGLGHAQPPIRDELRRIPNGRNVLNVASVWLQSFGLVALATVDRPSRSIWVVTFLLMGRAFALYAILGHEAAHRLLFSNRRANDLVGQWLLAYPAFVPFDLYRRSHFAHHKDEMGPNEPDLNLYLGYPITAGSMRRKLRARRAGHLRLEEPQGPARARSPASRAGRSRCASSPRRWSSAVAAHAHRPAAGGSTRCSGSRRG